MSMNWRTSSYSTSNGGECVETGGDGRIVAVRDTKDNGLGPVLAFPSAAWSRFLATIR